VRQFGACFQQRDRNSFVGKQRSGDEAHRAGADDNDVWLNPARHWVLSFPKRSGDHLAALRTMEGLVDRASHRECAAEDAVNIRYVDEAEFSRTFHRASQISWREYVRRMDLFSPRLSQIKVAGRRRLFARLNFGPDAAIDRGSSCAEIARRSPVREERPIGS